VDDRHALFCCPVNHTPHYGQELASIRELNNSFVVILLFIAIHMMQIGVVIECPGLIGDSLWGSWSGLQSSELLIS
jgi:hypothetical protein